jgi:hypothetical protein
LRALFRRVFSSIQDFLLACRLKANRSDLAQSLRSVMSSAGELFKLRRQHARGRADFQAGSQGCLAELQKVLRALATHQGGSLAEISHAVDSLIVLLVRIKPTRAGTAASSQGAISGRVDPGALTPCL